MESDFAKQMAEEQAQEDAMREEWQMGDYVEQDCPNCGRHRLCICTNGKHRCEKCNWCPELETYAPWE